MRIKRDIFAELVEGMEALKRLRGRRNNVERQPPSHAPGQDAALAKRMVYLSHRLSQLDLAKNTPTNTTHVGSRRHDEKSGTS